MREATRLLPTPPATTTTEVELIFALRRGDESAFERLVREHGPRMLAVARRLLPGEEDAQDALQDALLAAHRAIGSFQGGSRLATWLHRITLNAALMKLRSRKQRREVAIDSLLPGFDESGEHFDMPCRLGDSPSDAVERAETRELVRRCIDRLPAGHRTVLLLRDIEGLDTEATARVLGITENAAKIRLHRARQALRTLLEPALGEPVRPPRIVALARNRPASNLPARAFAG